MAFINEQPWYKQAQKDNPGFIQVGDYTYGEPVLMMWDRSTKLKIGKFCQIADGVKIYIGGEHDHKRASTFPFDILIGGDGAPDRFTKGDITIGNDVWIGAHSIILSGATIGDGAIIGAGSVVRKNTTIPPYSIAVGNPIEMVRSRFDTITTEVMMKLRAENPWWDWPIERIIEAIPIMQQSVGKFIERYEKGEV